MIKLTANQVNDIMDDLIKERKYSIDSWKKARFLAIRVSSATDKGNLGEDLLEELLNRLGYQNTILDESRRGPWDVSSKNKGKEVFFEVKVASQDTGGAHQFNGIRHDTDYSHLFLLGVMPYELRYKIIAKKDRDSYTMTPMRKGANSDFKITFKSEKLNSFDKFQDDIYNLLSKP